MAMEGRMCFMSYTVRLGQVLKWPFLMAWSKVFFSGLNRAMWYHLYSSVLLIVSRALSASVCCFLGVHLGLLVMFT